MKERESTMKYEFYIQNHADSMLFYSVENCSALNAYTRAVRFAHNVLSAHLYSRMLQFDCDISRSDAVMKFVFNANHSNYYTTDKLKALIIYSQEAQDIILCGIDIYYNDVLDALCRAVEFKKRFAECAHEVKLIESLNFINIEFERDDNELHIVAE